MKIVILSGSKVGKTTRAAADYARAAVQNYDAQIETQLIDLADHDLQFADGRNHLDYGGDTAAVVQSLLEADAIVIGTPIFQASIPGALKNVFDLLPVDAFRDKVVSMIVTAGSARHYLTAEHQLRPILSYMKAQVVQSYVFIESSDVFRGEIVNDDVTLRLERLVEDTVVLTKTYAQIRAEREAQYAF